MYSNLESDERKRREVVSSLYWSLMQNWNIPQSIQDYYGFTEDYRLYHQLEDMGSDVYDHKREAGEVPDILEVDARLTHRAEDIFERLCPRPPVEYLDKMNGELENLGRIAASSDAVHDIIHISPSFLVKYGIDKNASATERSCRAEKAYRELDARFVKMTGRKPYADEFFSSLRREKEKTAKENRPKQSHRTILRNPPSKGRKMSL